ncbi:DUF3576 domain-containing protein [Sulfitobacter donghicola]|uniref:DUF3576 domain-containing protein n=1 Tax=Sulfitobacter donghicola DSW-25 = KCTC 12864 = JCM 14565 TaxID=1300350 RepID=A0A073ILH3_9RHOB|nr:DUF3576 domain-containing protein [Sulfitobacter donghicola]KEJ90430.1 hypothetical protein DSW25_00480 [Sulfitobacter donghicola DSW-25 = KCTC 12864 = JCM 14565]
MARIRARNIVILAVALGALSACGSIGKIGKPATERPAQYQNPNVPSVVETDSSNTIWSLFNNKSTESTVAVNKYLWSASLEVLSFLPVTSVDPFTGVIVTGFGTPPGGGRSYRATVLIDDPALDARSLHVALQSRGGAVSRATTRAVEDAILSRARELRISDNKL